MSWPADHRSRFDLIWRSHRLEVLAYCVRRVSAVDAEDACAETFLVAWRRIDAVPAPPDTRLWLYGTARRVLANQWRSVSRRSRLDEKLRSIGMSPVPDHAVLVVQRAEDREVLEAVRALAAKDREIVLLDAWEELSREEIASTMGMTRAAVDQRIHRAYKRLARMLEPRLMTAVSPPVAEEGGT
jgi:RNA polymerase sigma-70 factor (ECF subfamily)